MNQVVIDVPVAAQDKVADLKKVLDFFAQHTGLLDEMVEEIALANAVDANSTDSADYADISLLKKSYESRLS